MSEETAKVTKTCFVVSKKVFHIKMFFFVVVFGVKKKTFISTGMSRMSDIIKAVNIFRRNKCDFVLMHCVSNYPCPEKDLNLNLITTLKKYF